VLAALHDSDCASASLSHVHVALVQEFSADNTTNVHVFNYDASDSESKRLLVPPLNYVAPELIAGTRATGALTSATDTYSFGELQSFDRAVTPTALRSVVIWNLVSMDCC